MYSNHIIHSYLPFSMMFFPKISEKKKKSNFSISKIKRAQNPKKTMQSREEQPLIGFVYHSKNKLDEVQKLFVDSLKRFEFVDLAKHNKSSTTSSSKTASSKRKQGLLEFENAEQLEKEMLESISTITSSIEKESKSRYSGLIFEFRFIEFEQFPKGESLFFFFFPIIFFLIIFL